MQPPRAQAALDYYPSRPVSAGEAVAVSLISPRTSKRIRRLPRPAESELDNLQVRPSKVSSRAILGAAFCILIDEVQQNNVESTETDQDAMRKRVSFSVLCIVSADAA